MPWPIWPIRPNLMRLISFDHLRTSRKNIWRWALAGFFGALATRLAHPMTLQGLTFNFLPLKGVKQRRFLSPRPRRKEDGFQEGRRGRLSSERSWCNLRLFESWCAE